MALLEFTEHGIYCPQAKVYIDPWKKVERAIITHGHSDHARPGMGHYLCTDLARPTILHRLGKKRPVEALPYGKAIHINGVKLSFHPAGHIIGSAQVRLEYKDEVAVISGDYKLEDDGLSTPFEPIPCHTFITETTFGLPIYRWQKQETVFDEINDWWRNNQKMGKVSILMGYSLGKSQRMLHHLDADIGPIYCHSSIDVVNKIIREQGIPLQDSLSLDELWLEDEFADALIIAPPGSLRGGWLEELGPYATASCSGWTAVRNGPQWFPADQTFVLSDHADWDGLNTAVKESGAERVFVTHGFTDVFSRWLADQGYETGIVETLFAGEEIEKG